MTSSVPPRHLVEQLTNRSAEVIDALRRLRAEELEAPSALPGWSRLTIACHLRYGADALVRITAGALAHVPVAYYPEGRDGQRPATLRPRPGESAHDVVESLADECGRLHDVWNGLAEGDWSIAVVEPAERPDLGSIDLAGHALLRLTELEVHGTDLDVDLADWSPTFVAAALPFRLHRLDQRRVNLPHELGASWLLAATDGPAMLVSVGNAVEGNAVTSVRASPDAPATATIVGSSRDLLALLLGRPTTEPLQYVGDEELGRTFARAFPGPGSADRP